MQLFRVLQLQGPREIATIECLDALDIDATRRLAHDPEVQRSEELQEVYQAMLEMNEVLQESKDSLEALRKEGAAHITKENLQRELDIGCLVLGHIMERKQPMNVSWYQSKMAHSILNPQDCPWTANDHAVLGRAKLFLQGIEEQFFSIVGSDLGDDEEALELGKIVNGTDERATKKAIDALMMQTERAVFLKEE
jgi:hypothetical protein